MIAARLIIAGRVQGIGYRDWLVGVAGGLGLRGWVRNLGETQVEALLCGHTAAVEAAITACWQGPSLAHVTAITRYPAADPGGEGFARRASV